MNKKCECGCGGFAPLATYTNKRKGYKKGEPVRFISGHNGRGELSGHWRGGRGVTPLGYVRIWKPDHPRADSKGYIFEHILVLEKALGRAVLPTEATHHIDGNRQNNSPGNLMLFKTRAMHDGFHGRIRTAKKCAGSSV